MVVIFGVLAYKGGVGKSTTTRLLGEYAAQQGHRTLLIDLDEQASLTQRYLVLRNVDRMDAKSPPIHPDYDPDQAGDWSGVSSAWDIYAGEAVYPYPTGRPNLDIIPAWGARLRKLVRDDSPEARGRLREELHAWLAQEDVQAAYDVVVIDTPASSGEIISGTVHAASHLVIPTQMEPQAIEGLPDMLTLWRAENRARPENRPIDLVGVLPTMIRPTVLHKEMLSSLRESEVFGPHIMPTTLALRTAFAESDHHDALPRSVFSLPASNPARQEGTDVCKYILDKALGKMSASKRGSRVSA